MGIFNLAVFLLNSEDLRTRYVYSKQNFYSGDDNKDFHLQKKVLHISFISFSIIKVSSCYNQQASSRPLLSIFASHVMGGITKGCQGNDETIPHDVGSFRYRPQRGTMGKFQLDIKVQYNCLADQTSASNRLRTLQHMLPLLLECVPPLVNILTQITDVTQADDFDGYREETQKLMTILESRLQFVLLNMVKTSASIKKRYVALI